MPADSLPTPATSFVGRDEELAQIATLLADPACRLLTLLGPGGIGKTRLALRAAADQRPNFENGVYIVQLAPVSSPDLIPSAIAGALQIAFYESSDVRLQLTNYLQPKHLLLVLDNFEHLLAGVDLLTDILQAAPNVKLLVTSRERMNLLEEWVLALDGLAFPKTVSAEVDTYSAVQLFAQRARQVQTSFSLVANTEAVRQICQRTEGMPLALELAATWLRVMSCAQIAQQIEANLSILTTPVRNVDERHRSLQAVFEQSWNLLSPAERDVLMRLSVFRGGFDLEAAEQVAGASLVILASLADKSLIRVNAIGRYDLHELLRQYAEAKLKAAHETEVARHAHSLHYAHRLRAYEDDLKGRRQQVAIKAIEADFDNVRAGWSLAISHQDLAVIDTVMDGLFLFCTLTSRLRDGNELFRLARRTLTPSNNQQPDRVWIRLLLRFPNAPEFTDPEIPISTQQDAELSLAVAEKWGDQREIALSLKMLGNIAYSHEDYTTALPYFEQSFALSLQLGDFYAAAASSVRKGAAYSALGQADKTIQSYEQALALQREIGDAIGLANGLLALGAEQWIGGRYAEALDHVQEAHQLFAETEDLVGRAGSGNAVGLLLVYFADNYSQARALFQTAIEVGEAIGYQTCKMAGLLGLSVIAIREQDYVTARTILKDQVRFPWNFTVAFQVHHALCFTAWAERDYETVRSSCQTILTIAARAHSPAHSILCLPVSAALLAEQGNHEYAAELLSLSANHPLSPPGLMTNWPLITRLRTQLETELGLEAYNSAWARGKARDLHASCAELLIRVEVTDTSKRPSASSFAPLSERELEILRLIAEGASNSEIAQQLVIGMSTVKKHINHIFGKLGVESRTQAIVRARALNLL